MASFSVLTAFWFIKTSQVKERSKEEKQRKEAVFVAVHCHFGRLYFVHRAKSPFKNLIFGTGLELRTNQVPIVVYFHLYKELKMANFAPAHASANFAPPAHASAISHHQPMQVRISHHVLFMRLWCEISSVLPTPHEIFSFVFLM